MKTMIDNEQAKNIIIIDDDEDDRDFFCLAVRNIDRKINITCCKSGDEALELLNKDEAFTPDHIFLDMRMPKMDGKQTLIELRKISRLAGVPIIIYSTTKTTMEEMEVKLIGAQHFLTKPNRFKDLVTSIASYLESDSNGILTNLNFTNKLTG